MELRGLEYFHKWSIPAGLTAICPYPPLHGQTQGLRVYRYILKSHEDNKYTKALSTLGLCWISYYTHAQRPPSHITHCFANQSLLYFKLVQTIIKPVQTLVNPVQNIFNTVQNIVKTLPTIVKPITTIVRPVQTTNRSVQTKFISTNYYLAYTTIVKPLQAKFRPVQTIVKH